jgi:hypothetical protein
MAWRMGYLNSYKNFLYFVSYIIQHILQKNNAKKNRPPWAVAALLITPESVSIFSIKTP